MSRIRLNSVVLGALALTLAVAPAMSMAATSPVPASGSPQKSAPAKAAPHSHATHAKSAMHASAKLDLNTATREELMKLPGIGEALADKIIAARPFTAKSELLSKSILTKAEYAKVASKVVAKQAAETSTAK